MVVPRGGPKCLPAHPFNALIFPILRDCLPSVLIGSVPGHCLLFTFSNGQPIFNV